MENDRLKEVSVVAASIRAGEQLAVARLITRIENNAGECQQILNHLFPDTGGAHIIGITGPPGSGKSTLVNCLAKAIRVRDADTKIGIIAIDPTSPFTGGAILGDRVRMQFHANDSNIFIRSMASRGTLGGIARAADNAALVMDAAGYDPVIIETVGAGQSEVEIASLAHTTIVVEAPGLGDDVQAAKAGLLEIADILVVNKADRPAADATARSLERMLEVGGEMQPDQNCINWKTLLLKTSAIDCEGIGALLEKIDLHKAFLKESGGWEKRDRLRLSKQIHGLIRDSLFAGWQKKYDQKQYEMLLERVLTHKLSPFEAAQMMLE